MTGAGHGPDSEVVDAARVEQARASSGPHNGRRAWRWLRGVLLVVGAALVLGSAVAVLARLTGWEGGPLAYGVALLPWLTAGAALAVLLGVVMRSRALVAAALAVSAAGGWWLLPLYSSAGHIPSGSPALTVATLNLTVGGADAGSVVALLRDRGIDVLALDELTPVARARLQAAGLDKLMPYSIARPEAGVTGTGLWSRHPLMSPAPVDGFASRAVRAGISGPGGLLSVLAVHPAAPGPFHHDRWDADTAHLRNVLDGADGSVLVLGDLNTTRDHRAFRDIEDLGYVDAAVQAGAGLQPTFPQGRAPIPLFAIDHVLARGASIRAGLVSTVPIPGADHRALVVQYFDALNR